MNDGLGGTAVQYVPNQMAYDTEIVYREGGYAGMLFGKYIYRIESDSVEKYYIDKYTVIASFNNHVILGYEDNETIILTDGFVDFER